MAILNWNPRFESGISSVDFEHRELINQIGQTAERIAEGVQSEDIEAALGEIHASISAHFALEESIMRKRRYADYEIHKADHEHLLDEIRDIMDACRVRSAADTKATLAARLEHWFSDHFKTHDARLHRLLPPEE